MFGYAEMMMMTTTMVVTTGTASTITSPIAINV
jgi:hypothetical protein